MPETITGDGSSFDNNISVPVDTDLASASSVKTPFQRLASNIKHLYDRVFTNGVRRVQSVANYAALRALTTQVDGDICRVDGAGFYTFSAGASVPVDLAPFLVKPTVGGGGWFHENYGLIGAAGGLPYLDATTKLTPAWVPRRNVAEAYAEAGGGFSTSSTTPVDITLLTVSLAVEIGDVLLIHAAAGAKMNAGVGDFSVHISDSGGITKTIGFNTQDGSPSAAVILWRYTIAAAGTVTVKGRLSVSNAANTALIAESATLLVQQLRP